MILLIVLLVFVTSISLSETSKCVARGRFPDNSHPNCRGYTMCLSGTASYDLLCPEHSIYSHLDNQCTNVTTYHCLPDYNCTEEGNRKSLAIDCKSYVACVKDLNNITMARLVTCPENEVFSVKQSLCVNKTSYECKPVVETPKVFEVAIDEVKIEPGNFSFHNVGYVNTNNFIKLVIICIISLILL